MAADALGALKVRLLADAGVVALVGQNVAREMQSATVWPSGSRVIRLKRAGGRASDQDENLDATRVRVDVFCYGRTSAQATEVALAVDLVLRPLRGTGARGFTADSTIVYDVRCESETQPYDDGQAPQWPCQWSAWLLDISRVAVPA